jgi:hypothetical protein
MSRLLYVDDLKVYAGTTRQLHQLFKMVGHFATDEEKRVAWTNVERLTSDVENWN